jgi:AraC-like DNA-binding protein
MLYLPPAIDLPDNFFMVAGPLRQLSDQFKSPHQHCVGQLIGSMKGLLTIGTGSDVLVIPACQAMWMPPNRPHWVRPHGAFDGWVTYVAEGACDSLPREPRIIPFAGLLREALLRAAAWTAGPVTEAEKHIATVILDELGSASVDSFQLPLPQDARLLKVSSALIDNPADSRDLNAWASVAALSERTLSRRFVVETGLSLKAWRQRARMIRALEMLADGQTITTIAFDLGYATPSAFIALFRRNLGTSPAMYRKQLSGMKVVGQE